MPHKRGGEKRANCHDLTAFINGHVDVRTTAVESFPLAFRLYAPLRKVVREAWESLKSTYIALGLKHLQAYLNEYTGHRRLPVRSGRNDVAEVVAYGCGDAGAHLQPPDRAPTESAPCGCSLIEVLERCRH
ncbi:hypothetical protein [Paenibacillus oralis]|uniref:hypothetical protein n=1 Tax=Paenibacillus oralis TaxID=2490856 RepID=UPI001FE7E78D|nr:hypothetical protein [Paenibacillus oralis]